MAVNMEVENTSKEIDTRLLTSDTGEFNDCNEEDSEDIRKLEDSLSSLGNLTIDNDECENTVIYAQLVEPETYAKDAKEKCTLKVGNDEKKRNCVSNLQECSMPIDENILLNEYKTETGEVISQNSTDDHVSQPPLAFTIEFGNNDVDRTKYQNLFERYNARHKRNLSTSKVELNTKKESSLLSPNSMQKQKVSSTHSEGYFSSEDDTKRKTDQLSEKLKQLGCKPLLKSYQTTKKSEPALKALNFQNKQDLMTRSYDGGIKQNKLSRNNLSLELGYTEKPDTKPRWMPQKSTTINDLSRIQTSNYDDDTEKLYTKNIDHIDIGNMHREQEELQQTCHQKTEKVSNINYVQNRSVKTKELSTISYTMEVDTDDTDVKNIDAFNVSNIDGGSDGAVSEAGTYTIHKDYTDEEKARMDIDKVFSVGVLTQDESNETYVHSFKMSISRDNNTWISEWATQVAEHNSLPPAIGGITGRTPPLSPSKIPSPIHTRSQRLSRSRNEQSDSSLDAESYLRIRERIGLTTNQHTLIDSGGESDDDTSNSYNTPPHSSQRTPVHNPLVRRGSLSESLFRRVNTNENRRSIRKYLSSSKSKTEDINAELSSHLGRRSSSLDRRGNASDTTESNTSRRNSMKYQEDEARYTTSPVFNRLRPSTPKLTNSPIVSRKTVTQNVNPRALEKTKHLVKSSTQAKNIGYFTCVENSPYMLRKSNSTTSYHEAVAGYNSKGAGTGLQNSPSLQSNLNIQRSCSNANIRSVKSQNVLSRRSSFNSSDVDRTSSGGRCIAVSDSSSEAGEQQTKSSIPVVASAIKLNRAFSIRRARLNCESDTTPNTTPEERRRRAQSEVKSAPPLSKQQNYHRSRPSNISTYNKESVKKSEVPKPRNSSTSRTDNTRLSMRAQKPTHHGSNIQRPTQKTNREQNKSTRSNSTLTSKEVEFQNWKRRKSYDPMKAAAEGRKKLVDNSKKHHSTEDSSGNHDSSVLRSASFHGTGGTLSLANEWSDNELNFYNDNQIPPPCSPQLESDSDLETSYYLQATQNVVSAMSARITVGQSPLADSDNDSDEDTSHSKISIHQNLSKVLHQPSDTESSDDRQSNTQPPISNTKYNRAFSLRRARLETQPTKPVISNLSKSKSATHNNRGKSESVTSISRTDSGRFSMRLNRTSSTGSKVKPKEMKKPAAPNAREVEMQNWKRRKSYDPMKAAMEGRRKPGPAKQTTNANLSPSHVARSQSFHGSAGFGVGDWSDEELVISADEAAIY